MIRPRIEHRQKAVQTLECKHHIFRYFKNVIVSFSGFKVYTRNRDADSVNKRIPAPVQLEEEFIQTSEEVMY